MVPRNSSDETVVICFETVRFCFALPEGITVKVCTVMKLSKSMSVVSVKNELGAGLLYFRTVRNTRTSAARSCIVTGVKSNSPKHSAGSTGGYKESIELTYRMCWN